jgi:hypothetical protein
MPQPSPAWIVSATRWLTPRRIRAQALVLVVCLWGVCAVDFATPGLFDRAGNIKFQDFLSFYLSGKLIAQGRAADLYNAQKREAETTHVATDAFVRPEDNPLTPTSAPPRTISRANNLRLPNLYGPQFGLLFVPLARLPFLVAAQIWVALNLIVFFACISQVLKSCPSLVPYSQTVILCAVAFPPLFHFFVRGQNSVLALACFTASFLALRAKQDWLAGMALGLLVFKPQFLVAIPIMLLLAQAWKPFAGLVISATAQLGFARIYFGPAVMHAYFDTLWHVSRLIGSVELSLAPIQMHSLRFFWLLLIPWPMTPWPQLALALYILSSMVVIAIAAAVWRSPAPLALRFSALTLGAVLVNPHLFVYDLLVLTPALLLLADSALTNPQPAFSAALKWLAYLTFVLPLLGPLSQWTHLQLSVPAMAALLWLLWRHSTTPSHKFASSESAVV